MKKKAVRARMGGFSSQLLKWRSDKPGADNRVTKSMVEKNCLRGGPVKPVLPKSEDFNIFS